MTSLFHKTFWPDYVKSLIENVREKRECTRIDLIQIRLNQQYFRCNVHNHK